MHSQNIDALANHFAQYGDTGMTMEPEAVAAVCAVLKSMADDARALERAQVPEANADLRREANADLRRVQEPARIIPFRLRRPAPTPPGGGDAA